MEASSEGARLVRALRLRAQGLRGGGRRWGTAADVARGMLASQAQGRAGAMLALSLRAADRPAEIEVLAALAAGEVVRNRPSRGTLQVTAPEDLGWLTSLLAPRSIAAAAGRRDQIGVTEDMLRRAGDVLRAELEGGRTRTRPEILAACAAAGVALDAAQAGHVLRHHTEAMTIVFAGIRGRADTFALADEWIDEHRGLERGEALEEVAVRYFTARGPATARCLGWWANLTMGEVHEAIARAGKALERVEIDGVSFVVAAGSTDMRPEDVDEVLGEPLLLPPFDEYLLGYRSREAVVSPAELERVVPGRNGMFKPIVVADGRVVGTWSRTATSRRVTVAVAPFGDLPGGTREGLARRVEEYGHFLGRDARMVVT